MSSYFVLVDRESFFLLTADLQRTNRVRDAINFGDSVSAEAWAQTKGQTGFVPVKTEVLVLPPHSSMTAGQKQDKMSGEFRSSRPPGQVPVPALTRREWQHVVDSLHHFAMYGGLEGDREHENNLHALAERIAEVLR